MQLDQLNVVLKVLRQEKKMKQGELAKIAGISQAVLSRIEAGTVQANWERWRLLFSGIGYEIKVNLRECK